MSDILALRAALAAMLPTAWPTLPTAPSIHEGEVRDARPTLPWLVWSVSTPDGAIRGEHGAPTSGRVAFSVTVAGRSEAEVSLILAAVAAAVDGRSPSVAGWNVGALVEHQPPRTWPDAIDLAGAATRGFVGVAAWRAVAAALPAA